jgi:hypothetical protein
LCIGAVAKGAAFRLKRLGGSGCGKIQAKDGCAKNNVVTVAKDFHTPELFKAIKGNKNSRIRSSQK